MERAGSLKRELTKKERRRMRRKHIVLLPVLCISVLLTFVIIRFDSLPMVARLAGLGIVIIAVLIFSVKYWKMEREIKKGFVYSLTGTVIAKRKLGGNQIRPASGVSPSSGRRSTSSATYYIEIDKEKFNVPASIYTKVSIGNHVRLDYFPESSFYLGISIITETGT